MASSSKRSYLPIALTLALAISSALALPLRQSTPDLRLLDALRILWSAKAASAGNVQLPGFPSPRASLPNVVLIVTEGVRADSYCSSPTPSCSFNPATSELFPDRVGLDQMRSLASFTVISMSALTTGRLQTVSRGELLRMPSVFDYLKAIRSSGSAPYTAYWSAHNHPMFERDDIRASIDSYVTAEELVGDQEWHEDADVRLMALFAKRLPTLPRPFFVILHVINTHSPYAIDAQDAPFTPWERDFTWDGLPRLFNTYRNAIVRQDRLLASGLRPLVQSPDMDSTIVAFTSDHGEEFGEHKQIHHGQDLFDEQTHVPGWIAFGKRTLSAEQAQQLRANAGAWATHLDILPTLLDAYGVLDSFGFEPYRARLDGRSLLRALAPRTSGLPMTSCTETFPCPFRNAGMMLDDYKIEAQEWDPGWNCWHLGAQGETPAGMDQPACRKLVEDSKRYFPTLPNGKRN